MIGFIFDSAKLLHHISQLGSGNPISAILFLTNACQFRCSHCIYYQNRDIYKSFKPDDSIDLSLAEKIISELAIKGAKSVELSGGGEPTLYPELSSIIAHIERQGLEWGLVTNGAAPDKIVGRPTWVRVSIDAGTVEGWRNVRGNIMNFWEYIKLLARMVKRLREKGTTVGASFVISKANYKDITAFAILCKKLGFEYARYTFARQKEISAYFFDILHEIDDLAEKAKSCEDENFKVIYQRERLDLLESRPRDFDKCYYAEHVPCIGADGWLYPCCELAYMKNYKVRNLSKDLRFGDLNINPQQCPPCFIDSRNKSMEMLIKMRDSVIHRNFL